MRSAKLCVLCLVLAEVTCLLTSCSGINTISGQGSMSYTKVGDAFLNDQITVAEILLDKNSNPPKTKVRLKNDVWYELVLEVKMDFYDESGVKLDNPWGWKPVTLEKGLDEWVVFTAPDKRAVNFRLAVKRAGS